jgi:two-component sensor histidine kinase/AmiR/NasT family two-component response regulator
MSSNFGDLKISIVDDNPDNLDVLSRMLIKAGFQVSVAINGSDAIEQIYYYQPDLILLDIMMPIIDGFEICRQLKTNNKTFDIPIIFITSLSESEYKLKGFDFGASDYIIKPFHKEEVIARVKAQLQLRKLTKILEHQNSQLKQEIEQRKKIEKSLFNLNKKLKAEIEQRKRSEEQLQQEIIIREQAERQIKKSLQEKEVLLKEIHHRVKNNLFVASSLLELQTEYIDEPKIAKIFDDSQNRIYSMALVHEQLYSHRDLDKLDFSEYLKNLVARSADFYDNKCQNIRFDLKAESILLNIETAHPCGLITNELIANAIEHAFENSQHGIIEVDLKQIDSDRLELIVKDNGKGFPQDFDLKNINSLGLQLVLTLVEQLEGKIEIKNERGSEIKIQFTELNYQRRF